MSKDKASHKQILRSTGIIGGTQVISIVMGILRTKIIAMILGPAGIGTMGVFQSIIDLVNQLTSFGINFSSVKDIAEANASNNKIKLAKTALILRRWSLATGLLGMMLTIIFCIPISNYSFSNNSYALSIACISITILLGSISGGQLAMLQGMRKIEQLAKASLYGAFAGLSITVPLYWWLGINGIVPGLILTAFLLYIFSWLYVRKIQIEKVKLSLIETFRGGLGMARLGFFIIITGFMASATLYVVRAFLVEKMDLNAVGYFQACWMITNMYLGTMLNAMLADFFPRLTEVNNDNTASNKLINEQMEITLLVGSPMIVGIIAFAALIIQFLYSFSFTLAIPVLQWQMAGTFFILVSWPLGVMFLAKSKGIFSLITESIWSCVFILFVYIGWDYFGFITLGIAFVFASFIRAIAVYLSTLYLGEFKFSFINIKFFLIYGALVSSILINVRVNQGYRQYIISAIILMITLLISYLNLNKMINIRGFINNKIGRKG